MTLLIPKFDYAVLTRDESSDKRLYATPTGEKLVSVTTILDKTKPAEAREALANWKKAVGEQRAQQIVTEAASRGTRMHNYLEKYIKGEPIPESVSNPYAQQSLMMARTIIKHGLIHVNEVWGSEVPLYFPGLYAGTTDCVGIHKGDPAILDFKQTNKPKKREYIDDYFIQLAAYALAHNEVHKTNIRKGVILMCSKDNEYQEFILEPSEFDYWVNRWCDRVSEYYRMI